MDSKFTVAGLNFEANSSPLTNFITTFRGAAQFALLRSPNRHANLKYVVKKFINGHAAFINPAFFVQIQGKTVPFRFFWFSITFVG